MAEYDVVVIGAGPVGENVADYARQGGLSVAVVEAELVGGECSYWACVPSKALLRPVHALAAAVRVDGARQAVTGAPDAGAALARRDSFVHGYDDSGQVEWLHGAGVTLVRGTGRLTGVRQVAVSTDDAEVQLSARHAVVLCTGSVAVVPPVPGLREAAPWTSREVTGMKDVPRRLAVVGGGVVACEMAAAVQGLGGTVTMLVRGDRLLERMEPFASDLVRDGLQASGVEIRFGAETARVEREGPDRPVRLHLADGAAVEADEVLVATGRRPRTADLGLETVGLDSGKPLTVDESLAVDGVDGGWLFAAGDVAGRVPLTHMGKYEARLLGAQLGARARGQAVDLSPWGRHAPTADDLAVPQVVFTDPEVAAVGLTKAEADERGLRTRQLTYPLGDVSGAGLHADDYAGLAALLVDLDREVVVGATFVGPDVAELLHAATVAVVGEVPLDRLWHAVPAYPTMSEIWLRLLEDWRRR